MKHGQPAISEGIQKAKFSLGNVVALGGPHLGTINLDDGVWCGIGTEGLWVLVLVERICTWRKGVTRDGEYTPPDQKCP